MMKDDDFKMLKGFALRLTDGRTNEQTFAIVESLSRLKNLINAETLSNIQYFVCMRFPKLAFCDWCWIES